MGTNGRKLMEGKPLTIEGKKFAVKTPFEFYDFSAHAGRHTLSIREEEQPRSVFCMHGDEEDVDSLASELKNEGFKTHAPLQSFFRD